ncbi:unnamed protein product [Darwinula stevensoni]|uniref:C1q domain-containing protein n=1 Tax=Darwinula stevensoni TaxID=69355 RepID=A0A7R9A199_9CRUS|nr:unnamed protein product [Darwinula stevensoni]CAG0886206.1 unnamed protein product [Darwinula stevensoni]
MKLAQLLRAEERLDKSEAWEFQWHGNQFLRQGSQTLGAHLMDLEKNLSALTETTREHAERIAQLALSNEDLRKANEDLRKDNEDLKLSNEDLKLSNEDLQSRLREFQRDRNETKLRRDEVEGRLQFLEGINTLQNTPRTCQSLADLGVTTTGIYSVDPDGVLVGDPPIKVFCDMETDPVSTIVLHDAMDEDAVVDRCDRPGCFGRNVTYNASMTQMVALIDRSQSCDQKIRYGCLSAALSTGGATQYAWWVDRHGQPQYYWHGWNATEHTCACGLTESCIDNNLLCNCDAEAPQWESDSGTITNETALPITQLRFGGLQFEGQRANFTLGGLVCRGEASSGKAVQGGVSRAEHPAESCSTLRRAGNGHTGFHLVERNGRLDVVRCRMDLSETDPEFQVETGVRIAEHPVYFNAYRKNSWSQTGKISFEGTELNVGNATDPSSGVFTAPADGIYEFRYHFRNSHHYQSEVVLRRNEQIQERLYTSGGSNTIGGSYLLELKRGDKVDLYLSSGAIQSVRFEGFLLYPVWNDEWNEL